MSDRIPLFLFEYDFVISMLPITLLHLLVPPASYFMIGNSDFENLTPFFKDFLRMLYSNIPLELFNIKFLKSLMFDPEKHSRVITHQWVTSMFVHADYGHLFSNLSQTIVAGYGVHCNVGSNFIPLIYLLGGIGGNTPISIVSDLSLSVTQTDTSESDNFLQKLMKGENPLAEIERNVGKFLPRWSRTLSCGSSGAVSALIGSNFVSHLLNIVEISAVYNSSPHAQNGSFRTVSQVSSSK